MFRRKSPKNKERTPASYVYLHNRAVNRYRQSSRILLWGGILNFAGLGIGVSQHFINQSTTKIPFYLCFGISDFLFTLTQNHIEDWVFWTLVISLTLILSSLAALLGVLASQGKKKYLIISVISYFIDWIFVFLAMFIAGETIEGFLFNSGIHAVITFFLVVALYQYRQVLEIEKRFEKPNKIVNGGQNNGANES